MDIMVDLETMGNTSSAAIMAVGAVAFDKTGTTHEFYRTVDLESAVSAGGKIDASTVLWWLKQSDEARDALQKDVRPITSVLHEFAEWVSRVDPDAAVWGNGATFDNVILANAYRNAGIDVPWKFWNDRCYRTLKSLNKSVQLPERGGVHHNALDDAKYQAQCAIVLLNTGVLP